MGPTSAYGAASPSQSAGHGDKGLPVQAKVEGLLPGTTYHYRLSAANGLGGSSGADRTFRTAGHPPPGAATGAPSAVGLRAAMVSGSVEPNDEQTSYSFQYGLTSGYGLQTAAALLPAAGGPVPVSAQLAGLAPGTTFHYRILAAHGPFVSYGADQLVTTLPLRQQRARIKARTTPRRSRHRPFGFLTTGKLRGGPRLPPSARCPGTAAVAFFLHKRKLALRLAPIQPDCTFSARAALRRHLPKARHHRRLRLRVAVRFRGNAYLAPAKAHREHVLVLRVRHRGGR